MDLNLKLGEKSTKIPVDRGRYQCLVGKLIYLSHTRPNITFAVSNVSQLGGERIAFEGGVVSCISFWTGFCFSCKKVSVSFLYFTGHYFSAPF